MGPHRVSMTSTSAATGEVILVVRPQQEGSPTRGAGVEPPWTLILIGTDKPRLEWTNPQNSGASSFILDDPMEERAWRSYHRIMGGMAYLLHAVLFLANDRLKQLNSVTNPYTV